MQQREKAQVMNDLTYRKMKKQLEKPYSGKYVVIADGKLLGAEDSLRIAASEHI